MNTVGGNIKKMAGNTMIYGLGNILNRAITFLLLPLYINMMTPREYGALNLIYPFLALMNVVYMYGLDAGFMRFFIPEKGEKRRQEIFSVVYISILVTTSIITAVLFLSENALATLILGDDPAKDVFALAFVILAVDGLAFMPVLYYRSIQRPLRYVSIIFAEVVVNLSLNILFVGFYGWGLKGVLLANIFSSSIKLIFAFPAILKNFKFDWKIKLWKDILKFGLPTVPAVLFAMIVALGDRFLIKYFLGQETVGVYSAGYKIGMIMALVVTAFRFAWHPFFLSIADQKNAKATFARILTLYLIIGSFIFLFVSLLAPPVLTYNISGKAIITPAYEAGLRIIPYILVAYLFQGVYVNLVVGMYIKKKTYLSPLFTGTGMLINLTTNILLMGYFGYDFVSAGIAAILSYLGQSYLLYRVSRKFYRIDYEIKKILRLGLIVAVLYFTPQVLPEQTVIMGALSVLLFFPALSAFGVLSGSEIRSAARQLLSRKSS
ncbi:MAG: oligosaccharide flippase family protein [Candidatus Marinimicrobia bacterium]|nr:oligosaccharide flippase family protein [Candidatus Neomarinimicrobiota bacterium]MCF7903858.1 oligosaccharide flippase family protein [Candidatus Neomarinimicrobiota bacterium]